MKDQADNLRKAIEKLGAARINDSAGEPLTRRGTGPPRVVAVTSGKGGVGKTSVSANLALALCEMQYKTLIIDADIGLANVEVLYGIMPGFNLSDALSHNKSLREIICAGPRGVSVISGGSGVEELARVDGIQMASFISDLSELDDEYDIIIIDTGAGISDTVLSMAVAADEAIIVTTPEPTSLTDAYALIKAISARERDKIIRIIINRADTEAEAGEIMSKLAQVADKFLDLKLHKLGYILNDPLVVRSIKLQTPFFISSPYSQTSNRIREIALRLMDGVEYAHIGKSLGLSGFLDRVAKLINIQLK